MKMREERAQRVSRDAKARIYIEEAEQSGRKVIRAKNVSYRYGDEPLIEGFSIKIMRGDRIGLIGNNGIGKTLAAHAKPALTIDRQRVETGLPVTTCKPRLLGHCRVDDADGEEDLRHGEPPGQHQRRGERRHHHEQGIHDVVGGDVPGRAAGAREAPTHLAAEADHGCRGEWPRQSRSDRKSPGRRRWSFRYRREWR